MTPRTVLFPAVHLDRDSGESLHLQIARQLRSAIHETRAAGRRVPSTRTLANLLGVSRNTVLAAYEELVADGQLEPRRGSGMHIAGRGVTGGPSFDLRRILREAHYPRRVIVLQDPDGQPLALNAPESVD